MSRIPVRRSTSELAADGQNGELKLRRDWCTELDRDLAEPHDAVERRRKSGVADCTCWALTKPGRQLIGARRPHLGLYRRYKGEVASKARLDIQCRVSKRRRCCLRSSSAV
jgi:hypothetical protein